MKCVKQKNKIVFIFLVVLTLLYISSVTIFCMPRLDGYKEYEGNIIEFCNSGKGFMNISDAGVILEEPQGAKDSDKFSYYVETDKLKQVYKDDTYLCVVTWDADDNPSYLLYTFE